MLQIGAFWLAHGKFLIAQETKICVLSNIATNRIDKVLILIRSQEHNQHVLHHSSSFD
jgi:hypothetical protein